MKKIITALLAVTAVAALSGCATSKQLDQTNSNLQILQNQVGLLSQSVQAQRAQPKAKPEQPSCLLGGQPYSVGAVVAGRICAAKGSVFVGEQPTLEWQLYTNAR